MRGFFRGHECPVSIVEVIHLGDLLSFWGWQLEQGGARDICLSDVTFLPPLTLGHVSVSNAVPLAELPTAPSPTQPSRGGALSCCCCVVCLLRRPTQAPPLLL